MATNYENKGLVTSRQISYYEARAKGGVGLIIVEAISIDSPGGDSRGGKITLTDDTCLPAMSGLTKAIHRHGARVAAQIYHAGAETHREITGTQPVGPSVVKTFRGDIPRELTLEEIGRLVQHFAKAAARAKRAGFDAVEIHGATCYLVAQFLSRHWNRRQDHYGGSLENRARFLLEVLQAARQKVGADFPVWCRINGTEFGLENGFTLEEAKQVAQWAEAAGADAIHVSSFGGGSQPHMGPTVLDHGILLPLAHEIKKEVRIPVIAVGRIDPDQAEKALAEGQADFIAIGRGLIADPELPNKLATGRIDDIRTCIGCLECIRHVIYKREPLRCSVNALCGNEAETLSQPAATRKRVIVVGGGPGGMEAAINLANRGHQVTLCEKTKHLGGLLRSALKPPQKGDIERFLTYLKTQLAKSGVKVHLGKEITPSEIIQQNPDGVIIASGALPVIPHIPGLGEVHPLKAHEAILEEDRVGPKVLIIGGGLVGCEAADYFSERGREVTIIEIREKMGEDLLPLLRRPLLDRLRKKGVTLLVGIKGEKAEKKRLFLFNNQGKQQAIEADTFLLAAGETSGLEEWASLEKWDAGRVCWVGDVTGSRGILEAVAQGNFAGRSI
jgi:2,4-dienoyl-CoA reductase-like NADH-dependent reductase (Old Yellow Enzyme family)/thioredoxin reductase